MADETAAIEQPNPVGRPSLYTPDMPNQLKHYTTKYKSLGDEIPTIMGFSDFVGVTEKTIRNWGVEHEEFLPALERLKSKQHQVLINKGLKGEFQPAIAKLLLCSNHGHKERTDTTSADEKIEPQIVSFYDIIKPKGDPQSGLTGGEVSGAGNTPA